MRLYLTEKPSQVQSLKKALKANNMAQGVKVVSLLGHVLAQMDFREIDDDFKQKSWNELVQSGKIPFFYENPFSIKYKKVSNAKFFKQAKEAIKSAEEIILATDPDNEGATLGLEVIEKCGALKKVKGMVNMNKLDFKSLKKEVKSIDKLPYIKMYDAGRSRALFDQLFGFNMTILATELLAKKSGQMLNVGAVKLPTIRMVVERDLQFENFKETPYWNITAKAKKDGKLFDVKIFIDKENIEDENIAKQIVEAITKNPIFKVETFSEKKERTAPPKPYSLTDLQSEANKKFKFTAKRTLDTAQRLYETHKVQSYPRTDNNYYAEGEYEQAKDVLSALSSVKQYGKYIAKLDLSNLLKRNIFDDSKITAHTALAPTIEAKIDKLKNLNQDEKKIFHLVATRYIIQFYPDYEYLSIKGEAKHSKGIKAVFGENVPLKLGWREIVDTPKDAQRHIPPMQKGDTFEIDINTIKIEKKFTKPKPRFTENTLLKAMEKIYRFYEDEEVKKLLKESGIGTPATRAQILEDLKRPDKSGQAYFKVEKGKIVSTQKARDLIAKLPDDITSPKVRAYIENKLKEIENGKLTKEEFFEEIKDYIKKVSKELLQKYEIRDLQKQKEALFVKGVKCPLCQGRIKESQKSFHCEHIKYNKETKKIEGCPFVIFKNQTKTVGRSLTQEDIQKLLQEGSIEGNGNILKLNLESKYFTDVEWGKGTQGNEVIETAKTYKLDDKYIFKEFRGKKLTKTQAKKLLEGKKIKLKLKSKAGKEYEVFAWLDKENKIQTEFAK